MLIEPNNISTNITFLKYVKLLLPREATIRLDHIAYRVKDRVRTADFFIQAFGYKVQTEFDLKFDDGTMARCFALEPPEKAAVEIPWTIPFEQLSVPAKWMEGQGWVTDSAISTVYHMAPEIFVSDGDSGSIVGEWVRKRDGIGGIHHLAYQVESVQGKMDEWREKGYAEFTTSKPLTCPDLTQVFTKPSYLTGVIYEFIERGRHGFCADNVKDLMLSTKDVEAAVRADHPSATLK